MIGMGRHYFTAVSESAPLQPNCLEKAMAGSKRHFGVLFGVIVTGLAWWATFIVAVEHLVH